MEEATGGFETVELWHADVHEDDVRVVVPGGFDGLEAVAGFGDDVDTRFGFENLGSRRRTSCWSSAITTWMVTFGFSRGEADVDGEPTVGAGTGVQLTTVEGDSFAHADERGRHRLGWVGSIGRRSVVDDVDFELVGSVPDDDLGSFRPGVFQRLVRASWTMR